MKYPRPTPPCYARFLVDTDLDEVVRIEADAFFLPWTRSMFLAELAQPGSRLLGLDAIDSPHFLLGFVCYRFILDEAHLYNVAVSLPWRNRGLGKELMRYFLRSALENSMRTATLEVARHNLAAVRLYQGFGFEPVGMRKEYYGPGCDALIMNLSLYDTPQERLGG